MIDTSAILRIFPILQNIKDRLMSTVPVISASVVSKDKTTVEDENLFLIWVDVYPTKRQTRFTSISVKDCQLMYFKSVKTEDGFVKYAPDWGRGAVSSMPINMQVSPEEAQYKPSALLFFIQPESRPEAVTIHLKSPHFLMSTGCEVVLTPRNDVEVR